MRPDRYEQALDDVNTTFDERDPFLSADGRLLFFTSNRSGEYQIYSAAARRESL